MAGASLRRRSLVGFGWAFGQQAGSQALRMVFSILLARILSPADYGLIGLAVLCLNFLQVLSRFGIGEGLIQGGDEIDGPVLSRLFRFHLTLSAAMTVLLVLVAPLVAGFFEQPQLTDLLRLLALNFLLLAGQVVPRSILERRMQFDTIARRALPATLLSGLLALLAAWAGWGVYSLVVLYMADPALQALLLLPWIPRDAPAPFARIRQVLSYSWKLTVASSIAFVGTNVDTAIIGKWIGPADLGLYQLGFRLTRLPVQNLAGVLDRVLFPAYSSISSQPDRIARAYISVLRGMSILMLPLLAWGAFSLPTVVPWLLPETWHSAIPVMQVFCLIAMVQTLGRGMNAVIQALGRSDVVLIWVFVIAPANILAALIGAQGGILGVAWALALSRIVTHTGQQFVIARLVGTPVAGIFAAELAGLPVALLLVATRLACNWLSVPGTASFILLTLELAILSGLLLRLRGTKGAWAWLTGDLSKSG